jgi:hypothetical protein
MLFVRCRDAVTHHWNMELCTERFRNLRSAGLTGDGQVMGATMLASLGDHDMLLHSRTLTFTDIDGDQLNMSHAGHLHALIPDVHLRSIFIYNNKRTTPRKLAGLSNRIPCDRRENDKDADPRDRNNPVTRDRSYVATTANEDRANKHHGQCDPFQSRHIDNKPRIARMPFEPVVHLKTGRERTMCRPVSSWCQCRSWLEHPAER